MSLSGCTFLLSVCVYVCVAHVCRGGEVGGLAANVGVCFVPRAELVGDAVVGCVCLRPSVQRCVCAPTDVPLYLYVWGGWRVMLLWDVERWVSTLQLLLQYRFFFCPEFH